MRGGDFIFDYVYLFYYKYHKIHFKQGRWYKDSPDWIKNKKTTTNPINKKDKCFQYPITISLNHEEYLKKPHKE